PKNLFEKCYDCVEDNNVIAEELAGFRVGRSITDKAKRSIIFLFFLKMGITIQLLLVICIKNNNIAIV
ncbi:hypothetical protein E2320_008586, partial [Naja naja]